MQERYVLTYPVPDSPDSYQPGGCNIGPDEVRRRWLGGHGGVVATIGLLAALLALDAPPLSRLLIAIPAGGAAVSYLQAYLRFCAAFGLRGAYNFGRPGDVQRVADTHARTRDRRRALAITVAGAAIGLMVGIAAVFV